MSKEELLSKGYKAYENDEISVFWNPELCQHATECVRGNSEVFDVKKRPWVDISKAPASEIADIIDRCPSGALKYELKSEDNIQIEFEGENNCSRAYDGDEVVGECHFAPLKDMWVISRTDVAVGYEGRGIGKNLVNIVACHARNENIKIFPTCPYAKKIMLDNPDYSDIIHIN